MKYSTAKNKVGNPLKIERVDYTYIIAFISEPSSIEGT